MLLIESESTALRTVMIDDRRKRNSLFPEKLMVVEFLKGGYLLAACREFHSTLSTFIKGSYREFRKKLFLLPI